MEKNARIVMLWSCLSMLFAHQFVLASGLPDQQSGAADGTQAPYGRQAAQAVVPGNTALYPEGRELEWMVDVSCEPNYRTIEQVNQQGLTSGTYWVEGYAARMVYCPPCPDQAVCETCLPNHIVISSDKIALDNYSSLTDKEMILFVDEKYLLNVGEPYVFLVQIINAKSLAQNNVHAKIIYYHSNRRH